MEFTLDSKILKSYIHKDEIYYYSGRLAAEYPVVPSNLDVNVFFVNTEFQAVTPIVHNVRPHSGVELTYREVTKHMHVISNARASSPSGGRTACPAMLFSRRH